MYISAVTFHDYSRGKVEKPAVIVQLYHLISHLQTGILKGAGDLGQFESREGLSASLLSLWTSFNSASCWRLFSELMDNIPVRR